MNSRLRLLTYFLATPCYHCAAPPCVAACPHQAIHKREIDGIVAVDAEKCVGAEQCPKRCLKACPWGAPQFQAAPDAKMQKCQLCLERLDAGRQPICVEACPMFALEVGPLEELRKKHGDQPQAEGFKHLKRFEPSVTFKPKEPARP